MPLRFPAKRDEVPALGRHFFLLDAGSSEAAEPIRVRSDVERGQTAPGGIAQRHVVWCSSNQRRQLRGDGINASLCGVSFLVWSMIDPHVYWSSRCAQDRDADAERI
jgi:hypothetical protein